MKPAQSIAQPGVAAAALLVALVLAAPAKASGGLNLIPDLESAIPLLIGFLILIYPLNALIFKPLFGVLDEREERISGARRRADQLQREATEVLGRYEGEVREVREEAERERRGELERARGEHASIAGKARGEAETEIERARREIESSLEDAQAGLRASAEALAKEAASRILGRSLS